MIEAERDSQRLESILQEEKGNVQSIESFFSQIEEKLDAFQLKQSIEEKHLQKQQLKVSPKRFSRKKPFEQIFLVFQDLQAECSVHAQQIEQIKQFLVEEKIEDGNLLAIIQETKYKSTELNENLEVRFFTTKKNSTRNRFVTIFNSARENLIRILFSFDFDSNSRVTLFI